MTDFTSTFRRTSYPKISPAANSQAGRTVLVTGSSEGIGYNIAAAFAEAHASSVILVSRSQVKLDAAVTKLTQRFTHTRILTRTCDVASIPDVQNIWTSLAGDGITVDVLVLNAGATEQPTTMEETISNLQFAIGSNVVLTEAFRAQPNPSNRPRCLINMSSAGMHCYPGIARQTIYHAGKAGFAAYIAHVTEKIPESEVRLVSLHPGCVFTGAVERASEGNPGIEQYPIWDDPSLSAHVAVWLAGPEASFLHGRFIWANWDVEELLAMREKIMEDSAMLKTGVIGVGAFSLPKLVEQCTRRPLVRDG